MPDPGSFRLRFAAPEDNVLLAQIGAETFFDTFSADNTPANMAAYLAQSFGPDKQARELADPAVRFLMAEIDRDVAGFAQLRFGPAPAAVLAERPMEIGRLYARKPWIGRGVGARLMRACLDEAARAGCDVVWLGVWSLNPRAIAFYQRWGFAQVGTTIFTLGDDPQKDFILARPVRDPA